MDRSVHMYNSGYTYCTCARRILHGAYQRPIRTGRSSYRYRYRQVSRARRLTQFCAMRRIRPMRPLTRCCPRTVPRHAVCIGSRWWRHVIGAVGVAVRVRALARGLARGAMSHALRAAVQGYSAWAWSQVGNGAARMRIFISCGGRGSKRDAPGGCLSVSHTWACMRPATWSCCRTLSQRRAGGGAWAMAPL